MFRSTTRAVTEIVNVNRDLEYTYATIIAS